MVSPHYFLIKPKNGKKYNHTIDIGGKELIIEDSYDNGHTTNREAIVVALPVGYKGNVEVGDTLIVHHNTFRMMRTQRRTMVFSMKHIKDDLYWTDTYYLHIDKQGNVNSKYPFMFLKPIEADATLSKGKGESETSGILQYSCQELSDLGFEKGKTYYFREGLNARYTIDGKDYFRLRFDAILAEEVA